MALTREQREILVRAALPGYFIVPTDEERGTTGALWLAGLLSKANEGYRITPDGLTAIGVDPDWVESPVTGDSHP